MANDTPLAQVEHLAAELPPQDQLKLIAEISHRLSSERLIAGTEDPGADYAAEVCAFLKMSDEMAAEATEPVDSADDIRAMRTERMSDS